MITSRRLLGALLVVTPAAANAQVVATLDGEPITAAAIERAAESSSPYGVRLLQSPEARRQTLDRVVETRLLAKAGLAAGADQDPAYTGRLEAARREILAALALDRYVAAHSRPADLEAFFAKDPARFGSKEIHASHILVADEPVAREALAAARLPGADFAGLVRRYAQGPSKEKDGSLGWFGRGRMLPEFEAAAFATPKGQVHPEVVKTSFGFHVIRVNDVRGTDIVRLGDVQERVREVLDLELRRGYLEELKAKAKLVVDEQALAKLH